MPRHPSVPGTPDPWILNGPFHFHRLLQGLLVILGVTLVVFVVMRLVGDPVKVMLPLSATAEQRAEFEKQLGLDRPIPEQFINFLGDLTRLDSAKASGSAGRR